MELQKKDTGDKQWAVAVAVAVAGGDVMVKRKLSMGAGMLTQWPQPGDSASETTRPSADLLRIACEQQFIAKMIQPIQANLDL